MAENLTKKIYGAVNITFGPYNGYVYFFHDDGTYSRFDRLTCELEYYAETAKNWNGWPASWKFPQAGVNWDNEFTYFMNGSQYTRFDMVKDRSDGSVESIVKYWPNWPKKWADRIDAGLYWGYHSDQKQRKAYFFRDSQYIRYDITKNTNEFDSPAEIKDFWLGWPAHWKNISSALDWGNGKIYFFSGMEYLRYDRFFNQVDAGYPRPLEDFLTEHREKLIAENQSLLFEDKIPLFQRRKFVSTVRLLAKELK